MSMIGYCTVQLFGGLYLCKLYADDLKLYSTAESPSDAQTMQDALNGLFKAHHGTRYRRRRVRPMSDMQQS